MAAVAEEPAELIPIPSARPTTLSSGMLAMVSGVTARITSDRIPTARPIRNQVVGVRLVSRTGPMANFQVVGRL